MVILFLCISLWIFAFCRFFISLCSSNIFASVIFFLFYVCSSIFWWSMKWLFIFLIYINLDFVHAIFLELIGLKWRVSKHARVLKTKNRSFFFSAELFDFFAFCRFFISLCFSNIFAYVIFFVLCLFLNFFVINRLTLHVLLIF